MQNSYISTPLAFSCKGSFCFSFNDYYFLNERIDKSCSSSLSSSSSCACSRFSTNGHGIPMNPRFLFGLRQSTLVQLSASRRLMILRGGGHYCPLPIYGSNRVCYGNAYRPPPPPLITTTTTTTSWRTRRRRGKREGRFDCTVWEEKSESWDSDIESDAEAMLSLLTEEIGEKFVGVGERKNRLAARRVQVEKRGRGVHECSRVEDKHVESDFLERNSKGNFESATIKSREEVCRSSVGKEGSLRGENHLLRKEGSSCSSYYSVLSSDGIDEKDVDVQVENGRFVGEFSTSHESKELRKEGEGVLAGKFRKQLKKYEDDDGEYGEVSTRRNSEVGSCAITTGVDWDSRNKVEKKITEVSVGQTESRKETLQNLYNVLDANESGARRASSSQKLFGGRENNSTLSMNLVEETKEQCSQTDHQVIQQSGSRKKAQQTTQRSEIHESEIERASISQTQSSGREKNLTASVNLVQEARERHSQYDSRIKSQKLTKMSEINDLDIERASASRRVFETRMKNGEEKSTSLQSSVQEPKNRRTQTNQEVFGRGESRKESEDLTNISVICTSDTEAITDSQQLFETRMNARVGNSTLSANLVQEAKEGNQTHEGVIRQVGSRKEPQRPTKQSSFSVRSPKRASSSQSPLNLVPQSKEKQMGAWKEGINSQVMVTPPSSQFVARGSPETVHYRKPTSGYATQEVSRETLGSGSSTLYIEEEVPDSPHKLDGRTRIGVHSMLMFHEDALGSANRFDASSTQFVGEFTEKLRHEVSTSEGLKEMTSFPTTSVYKDETYTQQGSSQLLSEEFQSQVHGSRRTSSRSEVMGPSDEMWDVPGPSSQEPSRTDAPAPVEISPSTTSAIVRRSSRSLWSIIGDLVRLRWGARSETHNLTVKSGGKSSSNESVGSEAWFSGHEQDDKDDENVKKRRISKPKESISAEPPPYLGKAPAQIQAEASEAMSTQDTIIQIAADTSPSSGTVDYGSASKGASSTSEKENFGWREDEKRGQISPSNILAAHSSSPLPTSRLISSPPVNEEISESSKAELSRSSFMEIVEQPITERPTKASGTEGKDGELKRRKLQRNKQFLQERFEEWEEAYKLESEQKKIDEMFMREALLEAKKAADTWEVPVGAVLVQHGKIIARGCNLVEQLRDSTAHAEMICIREASNLLRTWRLAETTLYVTLEPCPMCAGAILQARIDTVVWGAPNKLLGADGSWVRLFPGGGGGSGSDLTNQAAGPVHPFHPKMTIRRGILVTECADAMQQFFQLRRKVKEKKQESPPPSCLPISTHQSKFLSKMHDIFNVMFCL